MIDSPKVSKAVEIQSQNQFLFIHLSVYWGTGGGQWRCLGYVTTDPRKWNQYPPQYRVLVKSSTIRFPVRKIDAISVYKLLLVVLFPPRARICSCSDSFMFKFLHVI